MKLLLAILFAACCVTGAFAASLPLIFIIHGSGGGSFTAFTPLHTYFIAPTSSPPAGWSVGNDSNNGLSQSTPWATPNHAVVCGDVIVAAPAAYSPLTSWGTVSGCPSSSGGIDGAGGIYFATLLCAGNVGTCSINTSPSTNSAAVYVNANNWAVEGWQASSGYNCSTTGFGFAINTAPNTGVVHHVAFINNVANHNGSSFTVNSQGANGGAGFGADYFAFVGNIHQDGAGRCDSFLSDASIDVIGVKNFDTTAGTHIMVANNFGLNNQQTLGASDGTDGECIMADTLDQQAYSQQIVFRNNICALTERMNVQLFYQGRTAAVPTIKVYNNTFFASNAQANSTVLGCGGCTIGDIQIATSSGGASPWIYQVYNNISDEQWAQGTTGTKITTYALGLYFPSSTTYIGNTGINPASSENIFKGLMTSCNQVQCNPTVGGAQCNTCGYDIVQGSASYGMGVNKFADPGFTNTTDLLNNQMGTPNCTSFVNVTACMGWNANTQALTTPSVVSDLQPNPNCGSVTGQCVGKGAQLPSTTCAASDADFPTWLKGITYLHWTGTAVVQNHDLITTPCGL